MKTHIFRRKNKVNLRYFWILSIFSIVCLTGLWLFQFQRLASNSELLAKSQRRLAELSQEKVEPITLSNEAAELDKLAQNLGFEKIDKVHYIRAVESTVLAK